MLWIQKYTHFNLVNLNCWYWHLSYLFCCIYFFIYKRRNKHRDSVIPILNLSFILLWIVPVHSYTLSDKNRTDTYLQSSPPALTTYLSPLVNRMLVKWAEWPKNRLCFAWKKTKKTRKWKSLNTLCPCKSNQVGTRLSTILVHHKVI